MNNCRKRQPETRGTINRNTEGHHGMDARGYRYSGTSNGTVGEVRPDDQGPFWFLIRPQQEFVKWTTCQILKTYLR